MDICRSCGVCCHETELELSLKDINRIQRVSGKNLEEFGTLVDGIWQLKNIDSHCIFLEPDNNNFCKIYENRPYGCTTYPMIYLLKDKVCELDDDCPHKHEFFRNKENFKETCQQLKKWLKENFGFLFE